MNLNKRIICVDQDEFMLAQYRQFLEINNEFEIISKPGDNEAIALLEEQKKQGLSFSVGFFDTYETMRKVQQIDPFISCALVKTYNQILEFKEDSKTEGLTNCLYVHKPFSKVEVVQIARHLNSAWHLRQTRERVKSHLLSFIDSLLYLKKIEPNDLLRLMDYILSQITEFIRSSGCWLISSSTDGKLEYLAGTEDKDSHKLMQNPRVRACLDLIVHDYKSSGRPIVLELHGFSTVAIFSEERWIALFIPCSSLKDEEITFLETFIKKAACVLQSVWSGKKEATVVMNLQNKNEQLAQVNQQLRSNAERLKRLYDLSIRDNLTQLYNNIHFQNSLQNEFLRFHRYERERTQITQRGLALLLIDIDDFKYYNQVNGHTEGDLVLKLVSRLITQRLRATDLIARYGGDSLVVLLHEITPHDTLRVAESLRKKIEDYPFPEENNQPGQKITISIGIGHMINDYASKEEFIQAAEQSLLKAKRDGRNYIHTDLSPESLTSCAL